MRHAAAPEVSRGVPDLSQSVEYAPDRDAIRPKVPSPKFIPFKWTGHGGSAPGPHGIGWSHSLSVVVTDCVHEHAVAAPVYPRLQCPLPGLLADKNCCQLPGKIAHGIETFAALERHGHVQLA